MIPKRIHYCWFGGKPLDQLGEKCLKSWKKYFPDYEIIRWDESNVDLNSCQYIKDAYAEKKWAFVSDYIRFKMLYEYGGVYFDTDVEVVRSFEDILLKGAYMGCEQTDLSKGMRVAPGLGFAAEPGHPLIKEIIEHYESSSFYNDDGTINVQDTIVERTTKVLRRHGLKDTMDMQEVAGLTIYPTDYFCPIHGDSHQLRMTENTRSIHHYAASWVSPRSRFNIKAFAFLCRLLGVETATKIKKALKERSRSDGV